MKKKRAVVSVINDLVTDQRAHRTCLTLMEAGYDVLLIGRKKSRSPALSRRPYVTRRMNLFFEKEFLFYAEFQLRLLLELLFRKEDLLFSNDLDTLLPNFIVSRLKRLPILYDSHEYFTGVPELQEHPVKRGIWKMLEKMLIPRLKVMFTVTESIAELYRKEFGIEVKVMRNLPVKTETPPEKSKKELGLPEGEKIILLQGAGINMDRGGEEAIQAMQYIEGAVLLIIGGGDAIEKLKNLARDLGVMTYKVLFIPVVPFEQLIQYTMHADIGLTLDKDANINYRYSLPNKLFDYIHAGVPVLASPLTEVKKILDAYRTGECIESHTPRSIAEKINLLLTDSGKLRKYRENALFAKKELCWQKEKETLLNTLLTLPKKVHQL